MKEEVISCGQLVKELKVLRGLAHPQLLLLMGFSHSSSGLQLVFEHVELGSLYSCLHSVPQLGQPVSSAEST